MAFNRFCIPIGPHKRLFIACVSHDKMKKRRIWTYIIIALMISSYTYGQKGVELGGWLGATYYFGDLNTEYDLSSPGLAGGLIYRYNFNERLAVKFSGNVGRVNGDDSRSDNYFESQRNLHFRSLILDGSLQFEFNFLPLVHGSGDKSISPYLFAGVSGMNFNPQAQLENEWIDLRPLGTEGQLPGEEYSRLSYGLNYGFGLKFDIDYRWSINVEFSARYLYTDYIDDVSTTYPDMIALAAQREPNAILLSDPSTAFPKLGQPGRQRGNSQDTDTYNFIGVGLLYYFGQINCPDISK